MKRQPSESLWRDVPFLNISYGEYPQTGESQRRSLTSLVQRLNIVIDVVLALDYLHNHSDMPVIHCDLKPSNILLGLSRIIAEENTQVSQNHTSSLGIRGTIGYTALEYGMGSKVSTEGDVFSFGILLLEIFIGKKPTNENLDGLSLHQFVIMALPTKVMEIVDQHLLIEGEEEVSRSGTTVRTRSD
ncbi:hypothetical protein TIFTF001_038925 [Ficus carica]|uniref:Protein kinase domain-containing protein n=1 Tax=Ficus carica TaxID=3494 RepID=A0AA88EBE9_FICCA|nr:hypothetical protein TIFTF001_038925 [Ficus carica]